ncbi:DNA primase [Paenibacillus darwinianus]|uniref:Ribonuclease M5 n=1 Tax=Paenibacillus darwinianus TaxID=1380763 RepID=A0A9W5W6C8_9BACL|nr:ribonuclease M5 [Paenibacillus darwinianus]EXX86127.1 DNA primase [Paenibacillus darwinianus]EXX86341.1 DNA primase [Paenibacillus darwinianus]EXX88519.1 DNA primase [Paenibacillus darwinianus]
MLKEIVVVEGKDDTAAIKRAVEADTIETGGSAVGEEVLRRIELAAVRRGVIIFTDPDHAGERIRRIVAARVPGCKHAFLPQEEATYKGDIGIENAAPEAIRRALASVRTETVSEDESEVSWDDMMAAGLIVHPDAAARRLALGKLLGIGYANGKQFHKRCKVFRISKEEFGQALIAMEAGKEREEANHDG